jgi:hypothetical protein
VFPIKKARIFSLQTLNDFVAILIRFSAENRKKLRQYIDSALLHRMKLLKVEISSS